MSVELSMGSQLEGNVEQPAGFIMAADLGESLVSIELKCRTALSPVKQQQRAQSNAVGTEIHTWQYDGRASTSRLHDCEIPYTVISCVRTSSFETADLVNLTRTGGPFRRLNVSKCFFVIKYGIYSLLILANYLIAILVFSTVTPKNECSFDNPLSAFYFLGLTSVCRVEEPAYLRYIDDRLASF